MSLDNLPEEIILEIALHTSTLREDFRPNIPLVSNLILTSSRYARILIPLLYDVNFSRNEQSSRSRNRSALCLPIESVWSSAKYWKSSYILRYWNDIPNEWFDTTRFYCGKEYADDRTSFQSFLHELIHQGDFTFTQTLLEKGVNPAPDLGGSKYTPFLLAAYYGRVETCRALIETGAEIFAQVGNEEMRDGDHALMLAVEAGVPELVTLISNAFVTAGRNVDLLGEVQKSTPLYQAVQIHIGESARIVKILLDYGADMLVEPELEQRHSGVLLNSLQMGLQNGSEEVASLLVEYLEKNQLREGLSCIDLDRKIPLQIAISRKHWLVARKLIVLGSDLHHEAHRGMNTLHLAIKDVATPIIDALLEYGPLIWCDENSKWPRGLLLHHVAKKNVEGIQLLIQLRDLGKIQLDFQKALESQPMLMNSLLSWENTVEGKGKYNKIRELFESMYVTMTTSLSGSDTMLTNEQWCMLQNQYKSKE